ncbi:Tetratricopeptide repeat-containing protein [Glycomyces sambucus]|uniref:Tetratricopeptide repeat-containing protein n=1 Tax=Glycomyces sambucus TaxID=380244 RepID=A0A1G9HB23_9ACTN|nr:tetratricopeptide repeat protein [Glycomyces sambucus]SDL10042.1 Tetratricopeptide repeat-containing protein [Glycomyces sambucus]
MPESTAPEPGFTVNDPRVHNLIQGQRIELNMHQAAEARVHAFAEGPLLCGRIPAAAPARIERETTVAPEGPTVLTGMAGAGKTQAAAAFARRIWNAGGLDLLVWADASDRAGIAAAFAGAGAAVRGDDPAGTEAAAAAFLNWLARPNAPRWLVVLDGVTDPDHLAGLWPPETARGRTILTTQVRSAALDGHRVRLGPFTPEESADYLERRLGAGSRALDGAAGLAAEVGHLPQALALACAHLLDRPGTTCADYARGLDAAGPAPVAAPLRAAIERADLREPAGLASILLGLACRLDPAGVPLALFTADRALQTYAGFPGVRADPPLTRGEAEEAIAALHRSSLIDIDGDAARIHPLVQRAAGEALGPEGRDATLKVAADVLQDVWPADGDPRLPRFHATVARMLDNTAGSLFQAGTHTVLSATARDLSESGRIAAAVAFQRRFADASEAHLGPEHPDTLDVLEDLSFRLREAGEPDAAAEVGERVLAARLRVLGPDHGATLRARTVLSRLRIEAGDTGGAVAELEALVADHLRLVGPDDMHTFTARNNLAEVRGITGDHAAAVAGYDALLADCLRVFGPRHAVTLRTRNNRSRWIAEAGDVDGAIAEAESVLADHDDVLGPDDYQILVARANLAYFRAMDGAPERSAAEFADLLEDFLRVLGPEHPETAKVRGHLELHRAAAEGSD